MTETAFTSRSLSREFSPMQLCEQTLIAADNLRGVAVRFDTQGQGHTLPSMRGYASRLRGAVRAQLRLDQPI
jgi:hypothetical protein